VSRIVAQWLDEGIHRLHRTVNGIQESSGQTVRALTKVRPGGFWSARVQPVPAKFSRCPAGQQARRGWFWPENLARAWFSSCGASRTARHDGDDRQHTSPERARPATKHGNFADVSVKKMKRERDSRSSQLEDIGTRKRQSVTGGMKPSWSNQLQNPRQAPAKPYNPTAPTLLCRTRKPEAQGFTPVAGDLAPAISRLPASADGCIKRRPGLEFVVVVVFLLVLKQ